jgi:Carboxypeptidase regulatory-like domain
MNPALSLRTALLVFCFVFYCGTSMAQTTGTIQGTVNDPSGAVVPSATVAATLVGTQSTRSVTSDKNGDFEIPELRVGHYSVQVTAAGFKAFAINDVNVTIGHVVVIHPVLQVGESAQTVTVEANAIQVETTSTQLGGVMNDRAVSELPLDTRDTYQLLQLQPGVMSQFGGSSTIFYGSNDPGVVSVNGGRGRSNNYMVNGGDGNDLFANLPAIEPSPDAIQEFRVLTNTFDAEYGRNSGSVVNVVTKSGTDRYHGDFYEFFRNNVLDARNFFTSSSNAPDFKQNQFGGTLGGPILKNRTFFFASYEGRRIRQGISSGQVILPTAAELSGNFAGPAFTGVVSDNTVATILQDRCGTQIQNEGGIAPTVGAAYSDVFPNNQIPTQCFDPVASNLFQQFVKPIDPNGTGLAETSPDLQERGDQFTVRVDHRITSSQQLSVYYYFDDAHTVQPFAFFQAAGANVPGFGSLFGTRVQQWNIGHTWTIGATEVNEFHFNYFREGQGLNNHPSTINPVTSSCTGAAAPFCFTGTSDTPLVDANGNPIPASSSLGITPNLAGREGVPFINVSGGFSIGNNSEGELPQIGNTFQWTDNFTKIIGTHTMKFGVDVRRQRFDQFLYYNINGLYSFLSDSSAPSGDDVGYQDSYPDYFLGLPNSYSQGSGNAEDVRNSSLYLFAQDSWKIKPNLTLNYGLRWEFNQPMYDTGNRLQTFRPGQADTLYPCVISANGAALTGYPVGTDCSPSGPAASVFPLGEVIPGDSGVPRGLTSTYYKSFAPRIGLAWSPGWTTGWLAKLTGGPGNSSVRMGWGIFYNPIEQLVLEQFSAEPPFGGSSALTGTLFQTPFVLQSGGVQPNPFNGVLSPEPGTPVDWSVFRPILLFGEFQPHLRAQYSEQYNLTIQRQLAKSTILQIGYVGSQAHRLLASHDLNYGNAQTCLDLQNISDFYANTDPNLSADYSCGTFSADNYYALPADSIPAGMSIHLPYGSVPTVTGPNNPDITLVGLRPYSSPLCEPTSGVNCPPDGVPVFQSIFAEDTIANSSYNSLQVSVDHDFSHGLQFEAAYTFSKSIDDASSFENELNPINYKLSRAPSLFNATHRFVFSPYWLLPIPKKDGLAGKLLNGWGASAIITYQTGFPIRINSSNDTELENSYFFEAAGSPSVSGPLQTFNPRKGQDFYGTPQNFYFNPNNFSDAPLGQFGNASRTMCCGPAISQTDLAILKNTPIGEKWNTEFRAEFFNAWNHTQFLNPDGDFSDYGSTFGVVQTARDPRVIQFGLKFLF